MLDHRAQPDRRVRYDVVDAYRADVLGRADHAEVERRFKSVIFDNQPVIAQSVEHVGGLAALFSVVHNVITPVLRNEIRRQERIADLLVRIEFGVKRSSRQIEFAVDARKINAFVRERHVQSVRDGFGYLDKERSLFSACGERNRLNGITRTRFGGGVVSERQHRTVRKHALGELTPTRARTVAVLEFPGFVIVKDVVLQISRSQHGALSEDLLVNAIRRRTRIRDKHRMRLFFENADRNRSKEIVGSVTDICGNLARHVESVIGLVDYVIRGFGTVDVQIERAVVHINFFGISVVVSDARLARRPVYLVALHDVGKKRRLNAGGGEPHSNGSGYYFDGFTGRIDDADDERRIFPAVSYRHVGPAVGIAEIVFDDKVVLVRFRPSDRSLGAVVVVQFQLQPRQQNGVADEIRSLAGRRKHGNGSQRLGFHDDVERKREAVVIDVNDVFARFQRSRITGNHIGRDLLHDDALAVLVSDGERNARNVQRPAFHYADFVGTRRYENVGNLYCQNCNLDVDGFTAVSQRNRLGAYRIRGKTRNRNALVVHIDDGAVTRFVIDDYGAVFQRKSVALIDRGGGLGKVVYGYGNDGVGRIVGNASGQRRERNQQTYDQCDCNRDFPAHFDSVLLKYFYYKIRTRKMQEVF